MYASQPAAASESRIPSAAAESMSDAICTAWRRVAAAGGGDALPVALSLRGDPVHAAMAQPRTATQAVRIPTCVIDR
ncbi:MAG: hypothetical protein NVS1B4_06750 [Gemmatimonadaceae bacterium]